MRMRLLMVAAALALSVAASPGARAGALSSGIQAPDMPRAVSDSVDLVARKKVKRNYKRLKPGCRAAFCKPGYNYGKYKKWKRKRDFGRAVVGGVILGAVIVTAANAVPRRPGPEYCWIWSNSSRTRGYWDWCY